MWTTLPLLVLGGGAWWFSSQALLGVASRIFGASQPLHVEFSPVQPVELSSKDVSQGYGWKATTHIELVGTSPVPKNWKKSIQGIADTPSSWLVYRRGKVWNVVRPPKGKFSFVHSVLTLPQNDTTLFVDLSSVPSDAEEVRLRGKFKREQWFTGYLPRGWKPPMNMMIAGPNRILTLESKPFDVLIKGAEQPKI